MKLWESTTLNLESNTLNVTSTYTQKRKIPPTQKFPLHISAGFGTFLFCFLWRWPFLGLGGSCLGGLWPIGFHDSCLHSIRDSWIGAESEIDSHCSRQGWDQRAGFLGVKKVGEQEVFCHGKKVFFQIKAGCYSNGAYGFKRVHLGGGLKAFISQNEAIWKGNNLMLTGRPYTNWDEPPSGGPRSCKPVYIGKVK